MVINSLYIFIILYLNHGSTSDTEELRPTLLILYLSKPYKKTLRTEYGVDAFDHSRKERILLQQKNVLEEQQKHKRKELMSFLEKNYLSTNYFYDEMKRILSTRTLKDPLRLMVEYLEKPGNSVVKTKLLECYASLRVQKHNIPDIFSYPPNNLVINVIKDPHNDGVI
ncbi:hypothetical protein evm_005891 [Chilo suppressalis]|nr:hypothetical protein evm_005891 [Chilo suppressalis]